MLPKTIHKILTIVCASGLMSIQSLSMGIYNVLEKYLDSEAFCRVRMEAALALGHSSWEDNSAAGVSFLIKFLRAR